MSSCFGSRDAFFLLTKFEASPFKPFFLASCFKGINHVRKKNFNFKNFYRTRGHFCITIPPKKHKISKKKYVIKIKTIEHAVDTNQQVSQATFSKYGRPIAIKVDFPSHI